MDPKHPLRPLTSKLSKGGHESFQMRYYMTLYVKGLQSCRPSKLGPAGYRTRASRRPAISVRNSRKDGFCRNSAKFFFESFAKKAAVLQPLEIQRLIIPRWKGLITGYCLVRQSGAW